MSVSANKDNTNNAENSVGTDDGLPPPSTPVVRVFNINDLRAQAAFLRWYITSLRQHWQADADGQFGRTLALCGGLLDGEPNVLGVVRLVELFGEDVVREQALKAVQLSGQGQAAVLEQTGRAERTTGGILFYLVRQHYRQLQPSQHKQPEHEHQQQQQQLLSLPTAEGATALSAVVSHSQTDNQPQPVQPDVTLSLPGLDVTPTPGIRTDTPADVTFALDAQEQEQEQKLAVTSPSNQTETETEREETGEDDGWQGLKIPFLRLRYHRLIGSQSASVLAPVSSVDVTPSLTATATSADTYTATGTTQDDRGDRNVTPAPASASAGDNRWDEKLTFNAVALGTGSGSGMGFDSLRQNYPAEFGNYVALERELCQLIVNMTNALVGGDKLWDTASFQKVASQIFGKRARY
jgi:hypothetical protein